MRQEFPVGGKEDGDGAICKKAGQVLRVNLRWWKAKRWGQAFNNPSSYSRL